MTAPRFHKKYGFNPTIPLCYYCGMEKKEIALLGDAYKEKAPKEMVINKIPCSHCSKFMKLGVIFIGVRDGEPQTDNPYRTGEFLVIKDETIKKMPMDSKTREEILKRRVCFIEQSILKNWGIGKDGKRI